MPAALLVLLAMQAATPDPLRALGLHVAQPLSQAEAAAVHARVDAALEQAGAAEAFANISTQYGGEVQARLSGLKCGLGAPGQSVTVSPVDAGAVSCRNEQGGVLHIAEVVPAARGETLDVAFAAVRRNAEREPGYRAYSGAVVDGHPKPGSGRPDHRNLRYFSHLEGREVFTKAQVGVADGWVLTERRIGPVPTAAASPGMGELMEEAIFGADLHPAP